MLFFYDYIENTFLATPFAIFYLLFVIRYLRNNNPVMNLLLSSTMLALACLFHGQYTFLLPSLFAIIIFKSVANKKYSNALKDSVISIISIATIFIITFVLLNKFNYQIIVGNAGGAGDGSHFVPLSGASQTGYTPFLFLSLEHLTVISNIVFTCVPSFLILSGIMLYQFMVKKTGRYFLSPSDSPYDPILVACGSLSVCYVGFITLWRFDLGFPADIDLMLSSGFSLAILVSYLQFRLTDGNKYIMTISIVIGLSCTLLLESNFILSRIDESSNLIYGLQLQRPIHNIKMDGKTIEFSNYSKASKYTQAGWFLPNRYGITAYDKKAYLSFQMKENKLKSYKMMIKGKISYSNYRPAIVNIAINGEKSTSFAYAPAEETTKSIIVSADSIQKNNGIIIVRFEFPQKQNLFDCFVLRSIMFEPVD